MKFIKEYSGVVALVILAITSLLPMIAPQSYGATGTRMPNGISADTTSPIAGEVRGTTLTITSTSAFTGLVSAVTGAFSGLVTLNAGVLHSYALSTTTPASMTLAVS